MRREARGGCRELPPVAISVDLRGRVRRIAEEAAAAADPAPAIRRLLRVEDGTLVAGEWRYELGRFKKITVVGAGKASARMAAAVEQLPGLEVGGGLVVVKDGHGEATQRVEIVEGAHPKPDERGAEAARRLHAMLRRAGEEELIIAVLSGGGSALLPAPADEIMLDELGAVTELLMRAGADIRQLNAVRKHLSLVQGGRLAQAAAPATVLVLAVSDVLGNPLDVIASGPFAPDPTTFAEAVMALEGFELLETAPAAVVARLRAGANGEIDETPGPDDPAFGGVRHLIVADLAVALAAAERQATREGFDVRVEPAAIEGEARDFGRRLGGMGRELAGDRPGAVIFGGETTVTVRGSGIGGRCQEMALAAAIAMRGVRGVGVMAFGTDGTDGPTDAAGAMVDGGTVERGEAAGLDPEAMLEENDSYAFLKASGDLVMTGPTGTNVNDVMIVFNEGPVIDG